IQLINLAVARIHNDKKDASTQLLKQAVILDPELKEKVDAIAQEHHLAIGPEAEGQLNLLNLKTCVIVDSDDAVRQATTDALKTLGVTDIQGFEDGATALDYRSEEHTSELQSRENLVCRLLLEKKNLDAEASR